MTNIKFYSEKGNIVCYEVIGHADYAEHGKDIVCSAISALSCSIGDGITFVLELAPIREVKPGYLKVDLRNLCDADIKEAQPLLKTLKIGLKNISKLYPNHVKMLSTRKNNKE